MIYNKYIRSLILGTFCLLLVSQGTAQIDTDPKPYGGNTLMKEFICDEMVYPGQAMENNVEGTVEVAFTVMPDGRKTSYRIRQSVSPELDSEALRICQLIMFYPAVRSLDKVLADVVVPVKFNIRKYKRNCKRKGFNDYEFYQGEIDTSLIIYSSNSLDRMPSPAFEDPDMNFPKYIVENLNYPDMAYNQNITGKVELSFVVETSGRISNIEVIDPLGGGCTEEAIELIREILWNPGIKDGKAVRSFLTAGINFSLDNSGEHNYVPNNSTTTM